MVRGKVTNGAEVALFGHGQAIEGRQVAFVEFEVLLQVEVLVLHHAQFHFFLVVEHRVDPVAVLHVHRLDVVRFDDVTVYLGCLSHDPHILTSVLANDGVRGGVHYITLDFAKLFWHVKPALAPLVVVEVLLKISSFDGALAGEELTDLVLGKLSFAHDQDNLVVRRVLLEAPLEPNFVDFRVDVEDAMEDEGAQLQ